MARDTPNPMDLRHFSLKAWGQRKGATTGSQRTHGGTAPVTTDKGLSCSLRLRSSHKFTHAPLPSTEAAVKQVAVAVAKAVVPAVGTSSPHALTKRKERTLLKRSTAFNAEVPHSRLIWDKEVAKGNDDELPAKVSTEELSALPTPSPLIF